MQLEAVKDFLAGLAGCFVAVFASVWVLHGSEHALRTNVVVAMVLVALAAAALNQVMPGTASGPMPTQAEIQKAFTPKRVAFYAAGVLVFGLVVAGIGLL